MGQATLDLPDPMQSSSAELADNDALTPAALASADDLLSQLAGDDIDRLLAEADAAPKPLPPQTQPPAVPEPAAVSTQPVATSSPAAVNESADAAALDALFTEIKEPAAPSPLAPAADALPVETKPEAPVATSEAQMASELAELDQVLSSDASARVAAAEPDSSGAQASPLAGEEQLIADSTLAAAERQALTAPTAVEETAAPAADSDMEVKLPDSVGERASLPVRILQWINAPLLMCSDAVRETMGKVALLTLFNSLAVLVYVLLFRKHPHQ